MILIGISGKRGAGKDLLAKYFKEKHDFVNMPFAEELKESVKRDFNLTKEHTDGKLKEASLIYEDMKTSMENFWTPRGIMIAYGQFFRQFDGLWWVKKVFQKINSLPCFIADNDKIRVTISDVRFKNEADYIKEQGGYLIRLERDPMINIYKGYLTDSSETELDNYEDFDWILDESQNREPKDLERFSDQIMKDIKLGLTENRV